MKELCDDKGIVNNDLYILYELDGYINPSLSTEGVYLDNENGYDKWIGEM